MLLQLFGLGNVSWDVLTQGPEMLVEEDDAFQEAGRLVIVVLLLAKLLNDDARFV